MCYEQLIYDIIDPVGSIVNVMPESISRLVERIPMRLCGMDLGGEGEGLNAQLLGRAFSKTTQP